MSGCCRSSDVNPVQTKTIKLKQTESDSKFTFSKISINLVFRQTSTKHSLRSNLLQKIFSTNFDFLHQFSVASNYSYLTSTIQFCISQFHPDILNYSIIKQNIIGEDYRDWDSKSIRRMRCLGPRQARDGATLEIML